MCVLRGFPTISQKAKPSKCGCAIPTNTPFGIWFASPTVLYVADEGDGNSTYNPTANKWTPSTADAGLAGLQKWVYSSTDGKWELAYTLQNGLNLGVPYTVAGYPTGDNAATGLPWAPATSGLRNITGEVTGDSATIYAVTATESGNGDQGADPNKVVEITDDLGATSLPSSESFSTVKTAANSEVLRGVAIVPQGF
jgi:hypothetical protein